MNVTGTITHDEATIQSFMLDPEFAKYVLNEAIKEGDIEDIRTIWRRMQEAEARLKAQASALKIPEPIPA